MLNAITRRIRLKYFVNGHFVFPGKKGMAEGMLVGQKELYILWDRIYFETL